MPHTTNWQLKALTLLAAAVAICLTTACTTYYPAYYPEDGIRIVSSEPCAIEVPLIPSQEFVELARKQEMGTDSGLEYVPTFWEVLAMENARNKRLAPEFKRINDGLQPYYDQFYRLPFYELATVEALNTWDGAPTDKLVVVVYLDHLVDLRTVPPEDRIPNCIARVPVHIIVGKVIPTVEEAGIQ